MYRNQYISDKAVQVLNVPREVVEEAALIYEDVIARFLEKNGSPRLFWFYPSRKDKDQVDNCDVTNDSHSAMTGSQSQEVEEEDTKSVASTRISSHGSRQGALIVSLTCNHSTTHYSCCYFLRINPSDAVLITEKNVEQEVISGGVKGDLLQELLLRLEHIYLPAFRSRKGWGELAVENNSAVHLEVAEFLQSSEKAVQLLKGCASRLAAVNQLSKPAKSFNVDSNHKAYAKAATRKEIVQCFRDTVEVWIRQIDMTLSEARVDAGEEAGPKAELEYWKMRMTLLNSITDQLRSKSCKVILNVLTVAKEPIMAEWKVMDTRITDADNEAKDNVKYLATLEKFNDPLYKSDPVQMVSSIQSMMNAIRMMHSIARYYNTSEKMTALFVKITNQMIRCCKNYIIQDGSLWAQDVDKAIEKLESCITLNDAYQKSYRAIKAELAVNLFGKQFDFGEYAIFGKFDLFAARLTKCADVLQTIKQFSALEGSNIENIGPLCNKFEAIVTTFHRRANDDYMDAKNKDFNLIYLDFKNHVAELSTELVAFINNCFLTVTNTTKALNLLSQFREVIVSESINQLLEEKHTAIFHNYGRDLEIIKTTYEKLKEKPPVPRNTPPVAGAIAWSQQLLRKIEQPMAMFQATPRILKTKDAWRIIRTYNKVAKALVVYEQRWYEKWCENVSIAKSGLSATLLVQDKTTCLLYVNLDKAIFQLIREVKCLQRMGFKIPDECVTVSDQAEDLRKYYEDLTYMLERYYKIVNEINPVYSGIVIPRIDRLNAKLNGGVVQYTWSSFNIPQYISSVMEELGTLKTIIDRVNEMITNRMEESCSCITTQSFVCLPADNSEVHVSMSDYLAKQTQWADATAKKIEMYNYEVECATKDVIDIIVQDYTREDMIRVSNHVDDLLTTYEIKVFNAVMRCMEESINHLKDRICSEPGPRHVAVFQAEVSLCLQSIELQPSLEEIQRTVNKAARIMLECTRSIYRWRQPRPQANAVDEDEESKLKTLYLRIGKNRHMTKVFLQLTNAMNSLSTKISEYTRTLDRHDMLWDHMGSVSEPSTDGSTTDSLVEKMKSYYNLEKEIGSMNSIYSVGLVSMDLSQLKMALKQEAATCKKQYGQRLNAIIKTDMQNLLGMIDTMTTKLRRKITDIGDVNTTMGLLNWLREQEDEIETKQVEPVIRIYDLLAQYEIRVSKEEQDSVDVIGVKLAKLMALAQEKVAYLRDIAPTFKIKLVQNVRQLVAGAESFKNDYDENGPMVKDISPAVAMDRLSKFQKQHTEFSRRMKEYSMGEDLFGLTKTSYPELHKIDKELAQLTRLYDLYQEVIVKIGQYEEILWAQINADQLEVGLAEFAKRCRKVQKGFRDLPAYIELTTMIDEVQNTLPLLAMLKDKSIRDRHWQQISNICGIALDPTHPNFRLKALFNAKLVSFREEIEDLLNAATKEGEIEKKLDKISGDWANREFTLGHFKNRGEVVLKADKTSDLMADIEDSQLLLTGLVSNRYNAAFRKDIQSWVQRLATIQERIEEWLQVQHLWIYMEAIFSGSGDIAREMPAEVKRFANIDRQWTKIMRAAAENPNVIKLCCQNDMLANLLPHLRTYLEICQKSLSGYLESKRAAFPRFYFVSDAQLLEILGQASDPTTIQSHLLSISSNVAQVIFDKPNNPTNILGMISSEGEKVEFTRPVLITAEIVEWLTRLMTEMKTTIKDVTRCLASDIHNQTSGVTAQTTKQLFDYPAQVALVGIQFIWTMDSEMTLNRIRSEKGIMASTFKKFKSMLEHLVTMTRESMTQLYRTKLETLITIHIHQVDVFANLMKIQKRIKSALDFDWLKQIRVYWKAEQDMCQVHITDVQFEYCFEYLGCQERLVITDLTDRIYISCAQAMGMHYGGAPTGPAGTGKTETTRDMGRACGRYFIVINCSDQMNIHGMGRLFKGIAQSGCWTGFDEINRVNVDVLSVMAAQIGSLFHAKRERRRDFKFTDGTTLRMDPRCGVFITMNPGYAGRTELPENMKALFRNIAVVVPDRYVIIRVRLAAAGFQESQVLGRKFFVLYKLCEEQLSKRTHYHFGLRNILSVLRTCGATLRESKDTGHDKEIKVLVRVLRDMNMSSLVDEDAFLFGSLIKDLVQNLTVPGADYPQLGRIIPEETEKLGLVCHEEWMRKMFQFYEQTQVRHGTCIMGPSGVGKTTIVQCLSLALGIMGTPIKAWDMNPKAITATQMFGKLDRQTGDWNDGVFSSLWRRGCKRRNDHVWIKLDGPVDAIWVENLNTVLDDSRTLTLANGDRIGMPPFLKLVFEVENLDNASPATVSRMGMVYCGASTLGWRAILKAWLLKTSHVKRRKGDEIETLWNLFDTHIESIMGFVTTECKAYMIISGDNLFHTTLRLLDGCIEKTDHQGHATLDAGQLQRIFIFAVIWSLGGVLGVQDRMKLHDHLVTHKLQLPAGLDADTVFDWRLDAKFEWAPWADYVPDWQYPKPPEQPPRFSSILVPTVDNVRTEFLVDIIARQHLPVLLIGEPGTAKTVTIEKYLSSRSEETLTKVMSFSSATTPLIFQRTIESNVEKISGKSYGPPPGRQMMIFIDNVNMPQVNEWGDQETNELLRQLIEHGGFYNLDRLGAEWTSIVSVQLLGAMRHPGGGSNDIPNRIKRHFSIFNVTFPSNNSIEDIYGRIISGHYCVEGKFAPAVVDMANQLPGLTRKIWEATKAQMLPTPSKFHYIFNLRDLSSITQGMLRGTPEVFSTRQKLIQLWRHECTHVMADKFIDQADVQWFTQKLIYIVECNGVAQEVVGAVREVKYMADFLRDPVEIEDNGELETTIPCVYEPVLSFDSLRQRLTKCLEEYNVVHSKCRMDLVLFEFALVHLLRINRVIKKARGNALLVGVVGSGRQSLTRLAAFISRYQMFQLVISKNYLVNNLLDDLKALYKLAAARIPVVFLFTDAEVKEEGFLEYINMILTSGEIPGLHSKEELELIFEVLRPIARTECKAEFVDTIEFMYKFFINRVRDNLHVVLSFSPVGEKFRNRARKFPGMISGCTIDWFPQWPSEALIATAETNLQDFEMVCTEHVKTQLAKHMAQTHLQVDQLTPQFYLRYRRNIYVTPKTYLDLIRSFKDVYARKYTEVNSQKTNVKNGLLRLLQAQQDVTQMKKVLLEKDKELQHQAAQLNVMLGVINREASNAHAKQEEMQQETDRLAAEAKEIQTEKDSAESELEAAHPAINAAIKALDAIKQEDIATLKKLGNPPLLIKKIMDGVLILLNCPLVPVRVEADANGRKIMGTSWIHAKWMITDIRFLMFLQDFEKDCVTDEQCELLYPYLRGEDFTQERAEKSCGSIAGLCTWVRAMVTYHEIAKLVAPKRERLKEAELSLCKARRILQHTQAELEQKTKELNEMKAKYQEAQDAMQKLKDDAEATRRKLQTAEELIDGLEDERGRWVNQSKLFDGQINRLVGDVCAAATFLSYCGPFNQEFRSRIVERLSKGELSTKNIPVSLDLKISKILTTEYIIAEWYSEGLPTDELSIQNAIIVTESSRYPLLIDPEGQGKRWICNRDQNARVTSLNKKSFKSDIEESLSGGLTCVIEEVGEELDPILDPLLEKRFMKATNAEGKWVNTISLGDREIDIEDGFQLFITTRLANPRFSPEISTKVILVDFSVTMTGLEDQLLGTVILSEKAALEEDRNNLIEEINSCKRIMASCEAKLLSRLSEAKGNLLDDNTLIDVLSDTKSTAREVAEKLRSAEETEQKIAEAREDYRPIAKRGSILYFVMTEFSLVDPMYQNSLQQFLQLFEHSLQHSEPNPYPPKRIRSILDYLTDHVYKSSQRGLYVKHKAIYSLLMALKVDLHGNKISLAEFNYLIKGGVTGVESAAQGKRFSWLATDAVWQNLHAVRSLPSFQALLHHIQSHENEWRSWYDSEFAENTPIPSGYEDNLNPFQKMLLMRTLREDRLQVAASRYITDTLGPEYTMAPTVDFDAAYQDSGHLIPVICLLSPGSDPSSTVEGLSKKKKAQLHVVSMGQGQEKQARVLVNQGLADGSWVMLQNGHLSISYCQELTEQLIAIGTKKPSIQGEQQTEEEQVNTAFRLWITCESHPDFPISLLHMSIKITDEPPQGIRAGLMRSYAWISQDQLESIDYKEWRQLLYVLCFMHSVLIERKKFGHLGYCVPYEFNHNDLIASSLFLYNYLYTDIKKGLSWKTVQYMICEVQYGGRITDDYDKRLLTTYGEAWFSDVIFTKNWTFFGKDYIVPDFKSVGQYRTFIENLPATDRPEIFGLLPSAEINHNQTTARDILNTILAVQPKETGKSGGDSIEVQVARVCQDLLNRIRPLSPKQVSDYIKKSGPQPLNIFLRQECNRMHIVTKKVRTILKYLKLAIEGAVVLSSELQEAMDAIYNARVPDAWVKISWPSPTLGYWADDVIKRLNQFGEWVTKGRPKCYWLSGFFNPQGFLLAVKQEHTRKHPNWSLDMVELITEVTKCSNPDLLPIGPDESVSYMSGLFLDGAAWDKMNGVLTEPPSKALFCPLPIIRISATSTTAPQGDSRCYICPVYRLPSRTALNYIFDLPLKADDASPETWILRGVAALCSAY